MSVCLHAYVSVCALACMCVGMYTIHHTLTHAYTRTHTRAHTYTNTFTHGNTNIHPRTYIKHAHAHPHTLRLTGTTWRAVMKPNGVSFVGVWSTEVAAAAAAAAAVAGLMVVVVIVVVVVVEVDVIGLVQGKLVRPTQL